MPIVNRAGLSLDGTCVHVTIGKVEIPYISFGYGDNLKSEWVYRAGMQVPEDDTPGIYEPEEGSLKMSSRNARSKLFPLLPQFGAGNVRRSAIVSFAHPEIGTDSDALIGFRIMGTKASIEASAKGLECEFKVRYRLIQWTEKRICFGNPAGTGARGSIRL